MAKTGGTGAISRDCPRKEQVRRKTSRRMHITSNLGGCICRLLVRQGVRALLYQSEPEKGHHDNRELATCRVTISQIRGQDVMVGTYPEVTVGQSSVNRTAYDNLEYWS